MQATILTVFYFLALAFGAPSVKIINGDDVTTHKYPYQVSIQTGLFNQHQCGGALLSPKWVITSAHCVGISLLMSRVVAGAYNLSDVDNETVQIRNIDLYSVVKHPEFDNVANDVALLKMTEAFKINNYVQPLPISKVQCVAFDELTVFSGWGSQNEQNNVHPVLQTANMTVVPFEDCAKQFKSVYGENIVLQQEMHICVTGTAAPCYLDVGGPLVQDYRLIGLLTWIPALCSDNNVPSIFTSIGYYKKFIRTHVDDLF